ncbi:MAG TPA: GNAT family N-acetyltransferase [Phycisphaerales bacterium]|nr:GNAT family N-acetyltransferase [Phycisphaerales bacterium]
MLTPKDVAIKEEARCALGMSEVADEHVPIAGGCACRGEPKTWVNTAIGLGLVGEVTRADVDRLVEFHEIAGHDPKIEVCPYAHPSLLAHVREAGFAPLSFESVLAREIDASVDARAPMPLGDGITLRVLDPADEELAAEVARVVTAGFSPGDKPVREEDVHLFMRCIRHPRTVGIAAYADGACVGAGFYDIVGGLAALFGLSVSPNYRRRGVQQALMAFRLNAVARAGAKIATIGGLPGEATERNAMRFGFRVMYHKMTLVKQRKER